MENHNTKMKPTTCEIFGVETSSISTRDLEAHPDEAMMRFTDAYLSMAIQAVLDIVMGVGAVKVTAKWVNIRNAMHNPEGDKGYARIVVSRLPNNESAKAPNDNEQP